MKSDYKRARRREKKRKLSVESEYPIVRSPIKRVHVTDHAVVRYLERVLKVDIELVKRKMLADGREHMIRKMRSGKFPVGNGAKLVAVEGTVVTVS